jgi:membrane protease YdiL (CAAX protease family)
MKKDYLMFSKNTVWAKRSGFSDKSISYAPWILMIVIAVCFAVFCTYGAHITGLNALLPVSSQMRELALRDFPPALICILFGIIVPVAEECFWRGFIFRRIRKKTGFLPAAFLCAFGAAAYHPGLIHFLCSVCIGLAAAYIYERMGSLRAPVAFHLAAPVAFHLAASLSVLFIICAVPETSIPENTALQVVSFCGMITLYAALALVYSLGMIESTPLTSSNEI